ncbi:MAG: MerR family transcriptional regulator [Caulobacter sp.]|nr:MerR family transcriptional regulator [Caulobacter sp.]
MAKGPNAFRTISEAAEELGAPQHVLRFWESKFTFISPMKRAGGRRFYRPQDIEILRAVRTLLHDEGYTIKGVQKLHKDGGLKKLLAIASGEEVPVADRAEPETAGGRKLSDEARGRLTGTLNDLEAIKARLDGLLRK